MCHWHVSTLQGFLTVYNVIFLVSGLVLAFVGINELRSLEHSTRVHLLATYLLLTAAGFLLLVCVLGCIAIWKLHRGMIAWFGSFLVMVLLVEAACGILCFYSYGYVKNELRNQFRSLFLDEYGRNDLTTFRINKMQRTLKCCGMDGFEDWDNSQWRRNNPKSFVNIVPTSCCKTWSYLCSKWDIPNNIFYDGCTTVIAQGIVRNLSYIAVLGACVCSMQVFGIIIVYILYSKLRYYERPNFAAYSVHRNKYHSYEFS